MNEAIRSAGWSDHLDDERAAAARLHLLARWLLHCDERARQRGQLGVLAARADDAADISAPQRASAIGMVACR